jgi:hypothetical protein
MVRKLIPVSVAAVILYVGAYGLARWRKSIVMQEAHLKEEQAAARDRWDVGDSWRDHAKIDSLPALDAHRFNGVQEITRPELNDQI